MPERLFLRIPNSFMLSDTELRVFLLTIVSDDRLRSALLQCTLPVGGGECEINRIGYQKLSNATLALNSTQILAIRLPRITPQD